MQLSTLKLEKSITFGLLSTTWRTAQNEMYEAAEDGWREKPTECLQGLRICSTLLCECVIIHVCRCPYTCVSGEMPGGRLATA
jgi:hypothetical protein